MSGLQLRVGTVSLTSGLTSEAHSAAGPAPLTLAALFSELWDERHQNAVGQDRTKDDKEHMTQPNRDGSTEAFNLCLLSHLPFGHLCGP